MFYQSATETNRGFNCKSGIRLTSLYSSNEMAFFLAVNDVIAIVKDQQNRTCRVFDYSP